MIETEPRSPRGQLCRSLLAALASLALLPGPLAALVITEIMYHPDQLDDRPYEWIEIYNENADPLDLSGYTICDGPDFEFPPGTFLDGKEILVVCARETNVQAAHGITNTIGDWFPNPTTSPSLSNGGERITICNPGGKVVASVRYNDRGKWESGADGTGHSLEIESPYKEVDDPDSWDLSNAIGGSPGAPNPCWPEDDTGGPVTGGGPVGSFTEHIDVGFPCSPGDTTFASGTGRYTIRGSGLDIWQGGDQFHFAYVRVDGDFDLRARFVSRTWSSSRWGKGGIMARQDLTPSSRYVFVHDNPDPDGSRVAVRPTHGGADNAEPFILADGTHPAWLRLGRVGNTITAYHSANGTAWTSFGTQSWTGGAILHLGFALTSHSNCELSTLVWDQLTLSGTVLPPEDPGPDPGPGGGVCTPRAEVRISEAYLRVNGGEDRWVELHNRSAAPVSLTGYFLTDDPANRAKWPVPGGTSIAAGGYLVFTEAEMGFDLSVSAIGDRRFLALVEPAPGHRVVDAYSFEPEFQGYSEARLPGDDKAFSEAADPTRGASNVSSVITDVVLNEVLYHAIDNDNRKEYLELHNRGAVAQDLTGWRISDGIDFDMPPGTVIPAGGYLVIARAPELFTGPASIYGLPASQVLSPATQAALDRFGGLRNSGERVTLSDQLKRVADTVRYHDGGEWPRWPDGLGSSLELIDAQQDNSLGQAWDASDDSAKATAQTYSYVATHGNRDTELALALLDRGMALVDDISVLSGGVTQSDTPLIDSGATWRYQKGTAAPPASWTEIGFADGSWLSGPTGIGYGDGDDATELLDMQNGYRTVFCRRTFTVASTAAIDELILSIVIDDGFYAYLNGSLVGSSNVASPAFDADSPSAIEPTTVELDISVHKGLLVNGTNVLAIQAHNAGIGSSDLSCHPRLLNRTTTIGGGTERLTNGTFNTNTSGWVIEGTHIRSGRTTQSPIAGAGSLKIIASARGDNKVNRIETPTSTGTGMTAITAGQDVQISFKARWIAGAQTLLTNGYDHEMARSHALDVPLDLGTPGARNQVTQRLLTQSGGTNLGPVITDLEQDPAVPEASEAVAVRARVLDPDGVGAVTLRYALNNPSASPTAVAMTRLAGTDVWQATIPGQAQATRVIYFIAATDAGGRTGRYPVDITQRTHPLLLNPPTATLNDHRHCIYRHDVKSPATNYYNYRFWMTQANQDELSNRRRLSNDALDGSFVFGGSTIYYESQTRFSGSPWARGGWTGSFRVRMPGDNPLHGRFRRFGLEENQGNPLNAATRISHYLLRQHNGPSTAVPYSDVFAMVRWQVNDATTGAREHQWVPDGDFVSTWYPGDDEGDFLEMDDRFLIDDNGNRADSDDGRVLHPPPYKNGTNDANGDNRENYRWFFNLRAKGGADEYANFIAFARVMDPSRTSNTLFDQQILDHCDVEEMLRIWAVEMNIDDWDSWGMARGKNAYFYRPEATGQWALMAWDLELTYGNVDAFLIPATPAEAINIGIFSEVNRLLNRPKFRRMYYGILDEMVNGPNRWFHSSYLSPYAQKLAAFGMGNTGIAQAGGYIDQRASRLQSRIQSVVYPQTRLAITTSSGNNFSTPAAFVDLAGRAPTEVCQIVITNNGDAGTLYSPTYSDMTSWTISGIPLSPGANALVLLGVDLQGNVIDSDTITVTSTTSWNTPAISSLSPDSALASADIEILGSDFHNGVRAFFGATASPLVSYDENGPRPDRIIARVPAGTGTVNVTVRNLDNKTSNAAPFTYVEPPSTFVRADANSDGVIDLSDAVRIVLHLFSGRATDCQDALDVDDNEALNVTDAVGLLNYLFRAGVAPRAPFPSAGTDPGGATLGCER